MAIKILIADDHHMVRRGLMFFLKTQTEIEIVAEASNGREALALVQEYKPHVILMDLDMPEMDGIQATKLVKEQFPETKVIILTSFSDQDHVIPAVRAGADGYQLKDIEPDELVKTIIAVHRGERHLHPIVTNHVMNHLMHGSKEQELLHEQLTARELEVLVEISKGKSNKEIADSLYITEKTVKTHVSNILSKLQLQDRTQAALYAVKHQINR
ncbi:response regulator [Bacillus pinisoli]|uniref:response regulator n=1 Tax=Bacillus pinisoli TaxID=2901866 RepID=UPI001FF3CACF